MFKINLEKEILKQNRSLVSAKELLLVNEYDRLGDDVVNSDVIKRVFGRMPAAEGRDIRVASNSLLGQTTKFNQLRVFHISQIEKLCKKYHLRFLPSRRFNGSIDSELPGKIASFEIAYSVQCSESSHIAAPASSFKLEKRPKDPLMFYKINEQWFYLIHKWGNDLSFFRRFYRLFSNGLFTWLFPLLACAICSAPFIKYLNPSDNKASTNEIIIAVLFCISLLWSIVCFAHVASEGEPVRFVKENEWDSEYYN